MIVIRFDNALYLRTSWRNAKMDKVLRLRVGAGPVDFISEHLIPESTSHALTGSAYGNSTEILRNGSDEASAIFIDGGPHGGNHSGVAHYSYYIFLDGHRLMPTRGTWVGTLLTIREDYMISTDAAIAAGQADPTRAFIRIQRQFGNDGFCRFRYTMTAQQTLTLDYFTGMQVFKPVLKSGQRLILLVPGSNLKNGVDITTEAAERYQPPADWDSPSQPPANFYTEVRKNGVPQWTYLMGFNAGQNRGVLATSFYRSVAGKFYPRGYEGGNETLQPGDMRTIAGYCGSYTKL